MGKVKHPHWYNKDGHKSMIDQYLDYYRETKIEELLAEGVPWGRIHKELDRWETLSREIMGNQAHKGGFANR